MYKITSTFIHLLKIRMFKQSATKHRMFNLFIVLVMLFSSSASIGTVTAGTCSPPLYFDGSAWGLDATDADGINLALP
jgi:hypothetical protein